MTLPILYGEFGVESPRSGCESVETGTEPAASHVVDEATQAAYYREAFKVATCQANVIGMMIFRRLRRVGARRVAVGAVLRRRRREVVAPSDRDAASASACRYVYELPGDHGADRLAPIAPAAGATVGGTVTPATTADDVGVGKVSFLVDGKAATKSVPPYSSTWASGERPAHAHRAGAGRSGQRRHFRAGHEPCRQHAAGDDDLVRAGRDGPGVHQLPRPRLLRGRLELLLLLDGAAFAACSSPAAYTLAPGQHSFAVRAIDALGHVDPTPASVTWTVLDTTLPSNGSPSGPSGTTLDHAASFAFAARRGGFLRASL